MSHVQKLLVKENPLFNRREVEIKSEFEVSPKISEAENLIATEFSSNAESIKIREIKGQFGSNSFIIKANIYSSKEDKDTIEPKTKKERKAVAKPEGAK